MAPFPIRLPLDQRVDVLERRLDRLQALLLYAAEQTGGPLAPLVSRCTFCNSAVPNATHADVLEHVKSCPSHPMRQVEARLKAILSGEHSSGCAWLSGDPTGGDETAQCDCGLEELRASGAEAAHRARMLRGPEPTEPEGVEVIDVNEGEAVDLSKAKGRFLQFRVHLKPGETSTAGHVGYFTVPRPIDQPDELGAVPAPVPDPFKPGPELAAALEQAVVEIRATPILEQDEAEAREIHAAVLAGAPPPTESPIENAILRRPAEPRACTDCGSTAHVEKSPECLFPDGMPF